MILLEIEKIIEKKIRTIVFDEIKKFHAKKNKTELISIPEITKELQKDPVKIKKDDLLDEEDKQTVVPRQISNYNQLKVDHCAAQIRAFIRKNPGSLKNEIASFLRISHTKLSPSQRSPYSSGFQMLLEEKFIFSKKDGKRLRYYISPSK